jgi:23S rRNA pseudouridine1911/1915/1917 synthase
MIQRLTRSRSILLNRRAPYLKRAVRAGDVIAVRIAGNETATLPPVAMPLSILFEDVDVVVVDKPAGLLVHPTSPKHDRTLAHGLAEHFRTQGLDSPVRPVHRLDRDTSGAVLFARSAYAHQHLDRQLREGSLAREYLAIAEGSWPADLVRIEAPIGRAKNSPTLRAVTDGGEPAITRVAVVERLPGATLLRIELETGRTHQIRVHLAHCRHPVLGDVAYGAGRTRVLRRPALHSSRIMFTTPRGGSRVEVEAPLPEDLASAIRSLRGA